MERLLAQPPGDGTGQPGAARLAPTHSVVIKSENKAGIGRALDVFSL